MKLFIKANLYLMFLLIIALSSCESDEVTRLKFDQGDISMLVGQSDTLMATITFTGEISKFPHEWQVEDPTIISIIEKTSEDRVESGSFEKTVYIKALKSGTTSLNIIVGGKTLSCPIKVTQRIFTFNQALASNWGDFYETGTNNYDMYLLENTLFINSEGKIEGDGNLIYLEFYVPLTQNSLISGDFTLSDEGDSNTYYPGKIIEDGGESFVIGTRLVTIENKTATIATIKDGDFSITKKGGSFFISGEFILENNEVIEFNYAGVIDETDEREVPVEVRPNFTKGLLIYFGDAYDTKTSNNFAAYFGTESVNFQDSILTGEILMLEFNTALSVKDYIPNGKYTMISELTSAAMVPFSLVYGYTDTNDNQWGCWYYGETDKKMNKGSFTSLKSGDTYAIGYDFNDRFGSHVSGTFNGKFEYIDATSNGASSAPSYIKGNKKKAVPAMKMLTKPTMAIKKKPMKF